MYLFKEHFDIIINKGTINVQGIAIFVFRLV